MGASAWNTSPGQHVSLAKTWLEPYQNSSWNLRRPKKNANAKFKTANSTCVTWIFDDHWWSLMILVPKLPSLCDCQAWQKSIESKQTAHHPGTGNRCWCNWGGLLCKASYRERLQSKGHVARSCSHLAPVKTSKQWMISKSLNGFPGDHNINRFQPFWVSSLWGSLQNHRAKLVEPNPRSAQMLSGFTKCVSYVSN